MCDVFIPALMHIFQSSSNIGAAAVYEKVMQVGTAEGVSAHLLYGAVRIGVGVLSARRREEWQKILEKRERQRIVRRVEALERGGAQVSRIEQAPELVEKQFRIEIESATRCQRRNMEESIPRRNQNLRAEIETTKS